MARMEHVVWKDLARAVHALDTATHRRRPTHTDAEIVLTFLWARCHQQTVAWACESVSWPLQARRRPRPSPSTMSRRLRTASVQRILDELLAGDPHAAKPLTYVIDGKPLVVSKHSTDRDARYGRGAGGMDKGYKLHLLGDLHGNVHATRVTPLSMAEQEVARRMIKSGGFGGGYVVADTAYDWDQLHRQCGSVGMRLMVPRRPSRVGRGIRDYGVSAERKACIASMETPCALFGPELLRQRGVIERIFARLETRWRIGHPPFHVRTLRRVRQWVQAALILDSFVQRHTNPAAS